MRVEEIRKIVQGHPWRRLEIRVENGDVHRVTHPENIFVSDFIVVITDGSGLLALIGPEAISAIHAVPREARRASARR